MNCKGYLVPGSGYAIRDVVFPGDRRVTRAATLGMPHPALPHLFLTKVFNLQIDANGDTACMLYYEKAEAEADEPTIVGG